MNKRVRLWIREASIEFVPKHLFYQSVFSGLAVVGALLVLPGVIAVVCAAAVVSSLVLAYYSRRQMHRANRARGWADIRNLGLDIEQLEAQNTVDKAVLLVAGDPKDRAMSMRVRPTELRQALTSRDRRRTPERPKPVSARAREAAPPKPMNLDPIRRRIKRREAKIAELKALRESIAVPRDEMLEAAAKRAQENAHEVEAAALRADKEARVRNARGARATGIGDEATVMSLEVDPMGVRKVDRKTKPTPERLSDPAFVPDE